jgi:hypothetical protein
MAAPIQSPAKCEVHSVIQLLSVKGERPQKFTDKLLLFMVTCYKSAKCDKVVP